MLNDHGVVNSKYPNTHVEVKGRDFNMKERPTLMHIFNVLPADQEVVIFSHCSVTTTGKISDIIETYNNLHENGDGISPALKKKVRHIVACPYENSIEKYQIQLMEDDNTHE